MTDRVSGLIVVLEKDIRDDDIQSTIDAIRHIRYVADVRTEVQDVSGLISSVRADHKWIDGLLKFMDEMKTN